jgi:nucleoside-diphosphate-sugar epimerase
MSEEDIERLAPESFPAVVVRLSNTYGVTETEALNTQLNHGLPGGSVVHTFVSQAMAGGPLTIHGTGTQARDFVWINDIINALVELSEHLRDIKEPRFERFTAASGETWTITDVAKIVQNEAEKRLGDAPRIHHVESPAGYETPKSIEVDISKLVDLTGYHPKWSIYQGVSQLFDRLIE